MVLFSIHTELMFLNFCMSLCVCLNFIVIRFAFIGTFLEIIFRHVGNCLLASQFVMVLFTIHEHFSVISLVLSLNIVYHISLHTFLLHVGYG